MMAVGPSLRLLALLPLVLLAVCVSSKLGDDDSVWQSIESTTKEDEPGESYPASIIEEIPERPPWPNTGARMPPTDAFQNYTPDSCRDLSAADVGRLLSQLSCSAAEVKDAFDEWWASPSSVACIHSIVNWQEAPIEVVPILSEYLDLSKVAAWYNFPPAVLEALLDANCFVIDLPLPPRMVPGDDRSSAIYNRLEALLADPTFMDVSGIGWMHIDGPIMRALISAGLALPLGEAFRRVKSALPDDLAIVFCLRSVTLARLMGAMGSAQQMPASDVDYYLASNAICERNIGNRPHEGEEGSVNSLAEGDVCDPIARLPLSEEDKVRFYAERDMATLDEVVVDVSLGRLAMRELHAFFTYSPSDDEPSFIKQVSSCTAIRLISIALYEQGYYREASMLSLQLLQHLEEHHDAWRRPAMLQALAGEAWGLPILTMVVEDEATYKKCRPDQQILNRFLDRQRSKTVLERSISPVTISTRDYLPEDKSLALPADCELVRLTAWLYLVGERDMSEEMINEINILVHGKNERVALLKGLADFSKYLAAEQGTDRMRLSLTYIAARIFRTRQEFAALICPGFSESPLQDQQSHSLWVAPIREEEVSMFSEFLAGEPVEETATRAIEMTPLPRDEKVVVAKEMPRLQGFMISFGLSRPSQQASEEVFGSCNASWESSFRGMSASPTEYACEARWLLLVEHFLSSSGNDLAHLPPAEGKWTYGGHIYTFGREALPQLGFLGGLAWGKALRLQLKLPFRIDRCFLEKVISEATEMLRRARVASPTSEELKGEMHERGILKDLSETEQREALIVEFIRGASINVDFGALVAILERMPVFSKGFGMRLLM